MVCHLFYTERHSNKLTVINPSNFWGSLQTCPLTLIFLQVSQIIRNTNGIMLNLSVYEQIYNLIII